jgi:predicted acyl esterase
MKATKWSIPAILLLIILFLFNFSVSAQNKIHRHGPLNSYNFHLLPRVIHGDNMLDSVVRTDFTIVMNDGTIIDALKFVPVTPAPSGGWPTVMMVHGYGDSKETLAHFCKAQAEYGYYTMSFSFRGQGNSTGLSNLISSVEVNDFIQIVNWVRNDSLNGSDPDNILVMGGSQGGLIPFRAACNGAAVKTVITSVAPPDFASSWIENGCVKMTLLWTIEYTPDTARYTRQVDKMSDWIYNDNKAGWDSLARTLPVGRDFMNEVPNCRIPVFVEGSWQDKFFNARGIMQAASIIVSPFTSYIGAVQGHGGDHSPSEDQWHMDQFNKWFFQWLFNINTGIMDQAKYQYASTTYPVNGKYWTFRHDSSDVPLQNITYPYKLHFRSDKKLQTTAKSGKFALKNTVASGYTLEQAVWDEFTGPDFKSKFLKDSIIFNSNPLINSLQWTGAPRVSINYTSTANQFIQFNVQVYEILPNGYSRFITRANYMDRNYTRGMNKTAVFYGQAHSHIFSAGSRIRIIITNLDRIATDSAFFSTNPFVLPSMRTGSHSVIFGSSASNNKTWIELPVVSLLTAQQLMQEDVNTGSVDSYKLEQNYPNPFNPVTVINYNISASAKVTISVFDITGREVVTLVNENKDPGSYNVTFNAAGLSSGVYFYRIVAGNFSEVKRMMLIK